MFNLRGFSNSFRLYSK